MKQSAEGGDPLDTTAFGTSPLGAAIGALYATKMKPMLDDLQTILGELHDHAARYEMTADVLGTTEYDTTATIKNLPKA